MTSGEKCWCRVFVMLFVWRREVFRGRAMVFHFQVLSISKFLRERKDLPTLSNWLGKFVLP